MTDRLGWICARCGNSLSPDALDCPACAPEPGRCPECRMPLSMHHEPGCSQPCGRCEERKARDAEEARLTVRLPGYMGEGAVHVAMVTTIWAEVFPGVEASLRSVRTGSAEVEYRLALQDGQAHA